MTVEVRHPILARRRALVIGIANEHSIAYGCAKAFRETGAEVAITYLNDKARPYVEPLAVGLDASIFLPLDVAIPGQLETVFGAIAAQWGRLDILVHSIAFAPKEDLKGGLLDCSADGFAKAMDISCHSFVRMAKLAAPLMADGGTMFAMSYHGADRVVPNYNVMGPVKAALEASCRYLAYELGPKRIRVHAISPGPLQTRAARRDQPRARRRTGRHHGCRLHLRLPGHALRKATHRKHCLCGRRREHRRLRCRAGATDRHIRVHDTRSTHHRN